MSEERRRGCVLQSGIAMVENMKFQSQIERNFGVKSYELDQAMASSVKEIFSVSSSSLSGRHKTACRE